jgi:hypothetical protein
MGKEYLAMGTEFFTALDEAPLSRDDPRQQRDKASHGWRQIDVQAMSEELRTADELGGVQEAFGRSGGGLEETSAFSNFNEGGNNLSLEPGGLRAGRPAAYIGGDWELVEISSDQLMM